MLIFLIWLLISCSFIIIGLYAFNSKKEAAFGFWANAEVFPVNNIKSYNRAMGKLWCTFVKSGNPGFFYIIGKFYDLPYDIKNAPRAVHRCVRKLFDYVKPHLVRKAVKPLLCLCVREFLRNFFIRRRQHRNKPYFSQSTSISPQNKAVFFFFLCSIIGL